MSPQHTAGPDDTASPQANLDGAVRAAVGAVIDPELRLPIAKMNMLREIHVDADRTAHVGIVLTVVGCPMSERITADVTAAAAAVEGVRDVDITVGVMSPRERMSLTEQLRGPRAHRKTPFGPDSPTHVIAVSSGKGGVGKSTLTANLAVALALQGNRVGLVDVDVHGFSIPGLMGLVDAHGRVPHPTRIDDMILPAVAYDVKTISIGMFLREGQEREAVSWRGPLLHRTVQQFLTDVHFGDVDVLLLDMPPGTGDIGITVGQLLPQADVLVVTTPQPAATDIAVRSGMLARQTGQRVAGVVENMAPMTLPDGTVMDLFGSGGGANAARALSADGDVVPLLASVPLSPALRECGDAGTPIVIARPDDPAARAITALAATLPGPRRMPVQDPVQVQARGAVNIGSTGTRPGATTGTGTGTVRA